MSDFAFSLNDLTETDIVLKISVDGELLHMERDQGRWPPEWRPLFLLLNKRCADPLTPPSPAI